jgi:hypothetical protein
MSFLSLIDLNVLLIISTYLNAFPVPDKDIQVSREYM